MNDDLLPDADHVARYCGGATLDEEGRVTGNAFRLRTRGGVPETYLSVNWLELLSGANRVAQIEALRAAFAGKAFKVGSTAKFAVHQVGELCEYVRSQSPDRRQLHVLHAPEPDDESHAALHGLQLDDELIAELIAEVVQESFPAKA
jgi:hypothetical protein